MFSVSKERLDALRSAYPNGARVELLSMNDMYTKLQEGTLGTVIGVDDIGTIHVAWDTGQRLGVALGEDSCRRVDREVE